MDKQLPNEIVQRIIEAGTYAPSACNLQAWKFIVVTDPKRKSVLKNWHGFMKEHSDCKDLYITGYKNFLNDARAFVAGQEHNGVPHIELAELETALKNGWRGSPSKVRVRKRVQDVKAIHKLLITKTWKIIKKS